MKNIIVRADASVMDRTRSRRRFRTSTRDIIVRRPGEGSHPIFERDEIVNYQRKFADDHHERRSIATEHSDVGRRTRPDDATYEFTTDYRQMQERNVQEGRKVCRMCRRNFRSGRQIREEVAEEEYRTWPNQRLMHVDDHQYYDQSGAANMETYYLYDDPYYYEVWESSYLPLMPAVVYYPY